VSDDTSSTDSDDVDEGAVPLLLTGVAVCLLVVLLSIVFVVHQQWRSRRLATKLTAPSTPAHEALLARTDQMTADRRPTTAAPHDHSHQYVIGTVSAPFIRSFL